MSSTIIRAITFPIAEPLSGSWKDLRAVLALMWADTTHAANWIMRELYARDIRRNNEVKIPKYEHRYLYPEIRQSFPGLPPQAVASLERAVTAKYRALRYKIVWTSEISLPTFRYPTPFTASNQSWGCWFDEGNRPVVNPRIGDRRWELRLRGGPRYHRQLANFRQLVDGSAKRGELAIYKKPNGETFVKMAGHFPKRENVNARGKLTVKTAAENLLIAYNDTGEAVQFWNWPQVVRWVRQHQVRTAMFNEDAKAEQRSRRDGVSFQGTREAVSSKFNRRIDSAVKELAAQAVGLASRQRVQELVYDDTERHLKLREFRNDGETIRELFPWHALKARIATLCNERSIRFIDKGETE